MFGNRRACVITGGTAALRENAGIVCWFHMVDQGFVLLDYVVLGFVSLDHAVFRDQICTSCGLKVDYFGAS